MRLNGAHEPAEAIDLPREGLRDARFQASNAIAELQADSTYLDDAVALFSQLQQRYGTWLQVLPADGNLGCTANVNRLLQATTAPYVALADQDDLW